VRELATGNFDQLVVVLMENKNLDEVYGPAAYMTQLADLYSFSEGWASITNPSQPNYIAILGGSTFGVNGDGNQLNLNHPTMVDILENTSKTWKAFAEDASGSGCSINPPRGEDHFPFLSYTTITNNSARCANLLPGSYNEVISAFNAGTNFIWLTPNDCNNMHSCTVATGDAWIQSWVPNLLTAMAAKKAALIIMFDEAYHGLIPSLFPAETDRGRLGRRQPRTGRCDRSLAIRVLQCRRPGLRPLREPGNRLVRCRSICDLDDLPSGHRWFQRNRRARRGVCARGSHHLVRPFEHQRQSDIDVHAR